MPPQMHKITHNCDVLIHCPPYQLLSHMILTTV